MKTGGALHEIRKPLGRAFLIAENFKVVWLWRSRRGCIRNDPLKNRTNSAHPFLERRGEIFTGGNPEAKCKPLQSFRVSRNNVGLLFGLDLQTMLHTAEEPVSVIQNQHFLARKKIQLAQRSQRLEHCWFLQERMTRSVDKLQGLHDEFDLANTATSKFHVAFQFVRAHDVALDAPFDTGDFI